jgi:tetratricopeptide (TPR) repeat protein
MKAERKHELEHNELDSLLVKAAPFFRENGLALGIGAGVLLLGVVLYFTMFAPRPMSADADLWQDYFKALSERQGFGESNARHELEQFVDEQDKANKASAAPVLWAKLSLGNMHLAEGTRELFEDREAARDRLEEAEKYFLAVEKNAGRNAELLDRARYGLAQVYESQNNTAEAIKYYKAVVKAAPESALGKAAAKGERRLSLPSNVEFLAWFDKQKPFKRTTPSKPNGEFNAPPETPGFQLPPLEGSSDAPITPGFKLPSKPAGKSADSEQEPDSTPEKEPASESNDDPPPEKKPQDKEPAPDEQPE